MADELRSSVSLNVSMDSDGESIGEVALIGCSTCGAIHVIGSKLFRKISRPDRKTARSQIHFNVFDFRFILQKCPIVILLKCLCQKGNKWGLAYDARSLAKVVIFLLLSTSK